LTLEGSKRPEMEKVVIVKEQASGAGFLGHILGREGSLTPAGDNPRPSISKKRILPYLIGAFLFIFPNAHGKGETKRQVDKARLASRGLLHFLCSFPALETLASRAGAQSHWMRACGQQPMRLSRRPTTVKKHLARYANHETSGLRRTGDGSPL
jgi:hypothetical protein